MRRPARRTPPPTLTAVAQEVHDRHPARRKEDGASVKLLHVAPGPLLRSHGSPWCRWPCFPWRQTRQADRRASARNTSKGGAHPGGRDEVIWVLHGEASITSKNQIPGPIVSWITSVSFAVAVGLLQ